MTTTSSATPDPLLNQISERLDRLEEGLNHLLAALGVDDRKVLPVLVAAVHASLPDVRIVAVKRLGPDGRATRPDTEGISPRDAWSHAGRLNIFDSHRIR
jgi:hypothetical protein